MHAKIYKDWMVKNCTCVKVEFKLVNNPQLFYVHVSLEKWPPHE